MGIQRIVGTSLRICKGFGKEIMRSIYGNNYRKAAFAGLLAAMAVCGGCTRKEDMVFSLQNAQQRVQTAEESEASVREGDARKTQEDTVFSEEGGASESIAAADGNSAASSSDEDGQTDARQSELQEICVHVCGAVQEPGVYVLPAGSRVYEAVRAAGGFTEAADKDYVNQAQQLPDAVQLVIPTVEQVETLARENGASSDTADEQNAKGAENGETSGSAGTLAQAAGSSLRIGILAQENTALREGAGAQSETTGGISAASADGRININTASEAQLCEIPGVGAARAAAIAAYRQEHGYFSSIEDIMKVSGIKQGAFDKMKDSITVN